MYKQTVQQVESQVALEKEASRVLKMNLDQQEENYKQKLAARKQRLFQKRSLMSDSNDSSFLSGLPMTTRNKDRSAMKGFGQANYVSPDRKFHMFGPNTSKAVNKRQESQFLFPMDMSDENIREFSELADNMGGEGAMGEGIVGDMPIEITLCR